MHALLLAAALAAGTLPEHPRLLFRAEALPQIRERAANPAFDNIKRNADNWLTKTVALPDRGSQWYHWYACKKDGATLKTESPTRHVCPVCREVYTGYPYDDVVLSSVHGSLAQGLLDCGVAYQLSGDRRYAAKAKEILLAYAQKYRSYKLHNIRGEEKIGGGRVGPQTLDESVWLIRMAQGADLIWNTLTPAEQKLAADGLFRPAAVEVIQAHKMGVHNIQCWKNSAVGLVGFLLGDQALITDAIQNPDRGYLVQMAKGVSADGSWYEGAWGYHFYTMNATWPLVEAARNCGINLYNADYKRLFDGPLMLAMPNGHLPAFNDSGEADVFGEAPLYELALARYGDPRYVSVVSKSRRNSLQTLIAGVAQLPVASAAAGGSRNFPASGYAILNHGDTWLALKYGPHGGGHGHPDKLNFVLYSHGEVIAPDPGTAKYGVPIQKEWYRTTLAHNTLVVDERSQAEAQGACLGFFGGQRISAALADAGPIYSGARFQRAVALFGDDVLLFLDRVTSTAARTNDIAYHNRGQFADTLEGPEWRVPDAPGYMHFQNALVASRGNSFTAAFRVAGDLMSRFTAVLPPGAQAITGTGIGRNKSDRIPMVVVRRKGTELLLGWAVTLGNKEAPLPQLDIQGRDVPMLEATLGNRTCLLAANPQRQRIVLDGKFCDGSVICQERIGDQTVTEQSPR